MGTKEKHQRQTWFRTFFRHRSMLPYLIRIRNMGEYRLTETFCLNWVLLLRISYVLCTGFSITFQEEKRYFFSNLKWRTEVENGQQHFITRISIFGSNGRPSATKFVRTDSAAQEKRKQNEKNNENMNKEKKRTSDVERIEMNPCFNLLLWLLYLMI